MRAACQVDNDEATRRPPYLPRHRGWRLQQHTEGRYLELTDPGEQSPVHLSGGWPSRSRRLDRVAFNLPMDSTRHLGDCVESGEELL